MNNLQNNLNTIQTTVNRLANVINELSSISNSDYKISECTSFDEYPDVLKSIVTNNTRSIVTVFAYKISDINPGIPSEDGHFNFKTNVLIPPQGWFTANDLNANDHDTIWMSQAMFANNKGESEIINTWSYPIKLSSSSYSNTYVQSQSVYCLLTSDVIPETPIGSDNDILIEDAEANIKYGWTDTYLGVSVETPNAWISSRNWTNNGWSSYSTPVLYSKYAIDGKPADMSLISRNVFAFYVTEDENYIPSVPTGGKWNVNTNEIVYPAGWVSSIPQSDAKVYVWMSNAIFTYNNPEKTVWSSPQCLTGRIGEQGIPAVALFKSYVFKWSETQPETPSDGSYANPIPSGGWSDGVPTNTDSTKRLWCTTRWFASDNNIESGQDDTWSIPSVMADTTDFDVEFSSEETPSHPIGHPNTNPQWSNKADSNTIWMATSRLTQGKWSAWSVAKIKGENGKDGVGIHISGHYNTISEFERDWKPNGIWKAPDDPSTAFTVAGDLYVWDGDTWENVGKFQGDPGKSSYLHIKYANKSIKENSCASLIVNGERIYLQLTDNNGEDPGDYIGTFVDNDDDDPMPSDIERFAKYKWKLWRGEDGYGYEYIYILTSNDSAPYIGDLLSNQENDFVPTGWTDGPCGPTKDQPYEWVAYRVKKDNIWSKWLGNKTNDGYASLWAHYGRDGEKGEKGDKGDNGGFGPMARYSIWNTDPNITTYYERDDALLNNIKWYDMVEYNDAYYLCIKTHDKTSSPTPGSVSASEYWEKSSHFDFITAKQAAIESIAASAIEVNKLTAKSMKTTPIDGGAYIYIANGEFKAYANEQVEHPSIVFGLETDGSPRIEFWKDGKVVYIIGPDGGYRDLTKTEYKDWSEEKPVYLYGLGYDENDSIDSMSEMITELSKNSTYWNIPKSIYLRIHTINNEGVGNHGYYYTNTSEITKVSGVYLSQKTGHGFLDSLKDEDILSNVENFNNKYNDIIKLNQHAILYSATMRKFVDGKIIFNEVVFWTEQV